MRVRHCVLLAGVGLAGLVSAIPAGADEAARIRELEQKLERSMQLIEELSAKVQRLEKQGGVPTASSPAVEQQARVEALERQVTQLGIGLSRRSLDDGLQLHGFADAGFGHSGQDNPVFGKGRRGFAVGNLDLYLTPQFGDRVRALVELAFEVDEDGETEADLERAQFGYIFSDAATLWIGRFHSPFGYWNTAFHHGAQFQTSILRPRFLDFEEKGGILPAHTTGTWLTGSSLLAAGQVRAGYDLYLGNASRLQIEKTAASAFLSASNASAFNPQVAAGGYAGAAKLDMKMAGSTGHSYMSGFNAWVEPQAVDGLRLGMHGLRGTIEDDSDDGNRTRLGMYGGYGVYLADRWEVMGEYFRFLNRDLSGGSGLHRSWAGYLQAGYTLGRTTPYVRLESTHLAQADNYFAVQRFGRSYRRAVMGLRYDVDPRAALKLELTNTDQQDLGPANDRYNEARLQYSIRF